MTQWLYSLEIFLPTSLTLKRVVGPLLEALAHNMPLFPSSILDRFCPPELFHSCAFILSFSIPLLLFHSSHPPSFLSSSFIPNFLCRSSLLHPSLFSSFISLSLTSSLTSTFIPLFFHSSIDVSLCPSHPQQEPPRPLLSHSCQRSMPVTHSISSQSVRQTQVPDSTNANATHIFCQTDFPSSEKHIRLLGLFIHYAQRGWGGVGWGEGLKIISYRDAVVKLQELFKTFLASS